MVMKNVGVLALQGAFAKHVEVLHSLGVNAVEVRKPADLDSCDGLIIPGGESTTILLNMQFIQFDKAIETFAKTHPVFGTCAGLILMAKEIIDDPRTPFDLIDVAVERNAFGRQAESFSTTVDFQSQKGKKKVKGLFIRAPRIRRVGEGVEVLATLEQEPVVVRQGFHMASTFHPELMADATLHSYFIGLT